MEDRVRLRRQMDDIYAATPVEKIPWCLETLPVALVELLDAGWVKPCRAIDLGCGAGHYAVALAARGFEVTGVDLSAEAITLARGRADERGVDCRFEVADLAEGVGAVGEGFELAYDWEVLHHVFPADRPAYVANVQRLLAPGGKYLSVCFSEKSPQFGGEGKIRTTPIDTRLYFSSEEELRALFTPHFEIETLKTIEVAGKYAPHLAAIAQMTRR